MALPKFPRPGMSSIVSSVTGAGTTGLHVTMAIIDPRHATPRGTSVFAGDIDRLGMSFRTFKDPMEKTLDLVVIPSIIKNFQAQGRPRWAPLSLSTIKNRLDSGFSTGPILHRTGRLRREATRKNIWQLTSSEFSLGGYDTLKLRTIFFDGKVPYARFNQLGTGSKQKTFLVPLDIASDFNPPGSENPFDTLNRTHLEVRFGGVRHKPKPGSGSPPRPFIQLTVEEEVEIYNIFVDFMVVQVNKHWGPEV
jgi:phage gpG-like protein